MNQKLNLYRLLLLVVFPLVGLAGHPSTGQAQVGYTASITTPNTEAFPTVSFYLGVWDEEGKFVKDLEQRFVTITENGLYRPPTSLTLERPGVQFVVVINPGPSLAIRDDSGTPRLEYVTQALSDWADALGDSRLDDLSLLTLDGPQATHINDSLLWKKTLQAYQPELRQASPSLEILSRSLEVAADPPPRPHMGKVLLIITPPLPQEANPGLQTLAAQANQLGVHVNVWMIASTQMFSTPSAARLAELAAQTGGEFFAFSGSEPFPPPDSYLERYRSIYQVSYSSQVATSGQHKLALWIHTPAWQLTTSTQSFEVNVQPPNLAFISPPAEIVRSTSDIFSPAATDPSTYFPENQSLEILIEFPDGHPRPVKWSALYVDGELVASNITPPFDRFSWDLTGYTITSKHFLRAEVEDTLGLTGKTIDLPVTVVIKLPEHRMVTVLYLKGPQLIVIGLIVLSLSVVLGMLLSGRLRPRPLGTIRRKRGPKPKTKRRPMVSRETTQRFGDWFRRIHWPERSQPTPVFAYLIQLEADLQPAKHSPIPITMEEITFGSDPQQATVLVEDSSVEGLHARLQLTEEQTFRLLDEGTIAGTWLNFEVLPPDGVLLQDGDVIHIGGVGFRFQIHNSKRVVEKPDVIPLASGQGGEEHLPPQS